MPLVIRTATENDIDAMYEISCSVHLTPLYRQLIPEAHYEKFLRRYTPSPSRLASYYEKFVTRLYDPTWHIWVAELDDEVVGFTAAHDQGLVLELKGLFVAEPHQHHGIGKQLFAASCQVATSAQTIVLEVIESNDRAVRLYERAGFERGAVIDQYYGAPMLQMYKQSKH